MIVIRCNKCKRDVSRAWRLILQEEAEFPPGALRGGGRLFEQTHLCLDCMNVLAETFGLVRTPPPEAPMTSPEKDFSQEKVQGLPEGGLYKAWK